MTTVSTTTNPTEINALIEKAVDTPVEKPAKKPVEVLNPFDNVIDLPGGFITPAGEVITKVEVKELTGRDEEAISKASTIARALNSILMRGTAKIGEEEATDKLLDQMLAGDRDAVLLGIYRATFGNEAELPVMCQTCNDFKTMVVDVDTDIPVKKLEDPYDRQFEVQGKKNTYRCELPTGHTQRELLSNADKTVSELSTILLQNTVLEINGTAVYDKNQVLNLGVADRRKISDEIAKRNPGPQLQDVKAPCPDCGEEVQVPINIGTLFRF